MVSMNLPVLSNEAGFSRYLREISAFPMLTKEEEFALARGWKKHEDISSAQKLVTSHLRLVVKLQDPLKVMVCQWQILFLKAILASCAPLKVLIRSADFA